MELQMGFASGVRLTAALKSLAVAVVMIVGTVSMSAWAQDVARGEPGAPPDDHVLQAQLEEENAAFNKYVLNDQETIGTEMPGVGTAQEEVAPPQAAEVAPGVYGVPGDPKFEAQFNRLLEQSDQEELARLAHDLPEEGPASATPGRPGSEPAVEPTERRR